jgi:two-component system, response regulator PdtaR
MLEPEANVQPEPHRVLVVEDEVLIRMLIADELRLAGFVVVEAGSANEALSYLTSGEPVHLVFTDITMPGSMDGLDLAREIKKSRPGLPIVLASGTIDAAPDRRLGVFLEKPYDVNRTVALVSKLIAGASEARRA